MKRTLLTSLTAAAVFAMAATAAIAQPSAPAGPPAQKGAAGAQAFGYQLMTPAERDEWRQKMNAAKTPAERTQLRSEHHAQMMQRADEQGVTLTGPRGEPTMYGQQLMTPAERTAYMEKMRAATSRDERIKLRDEHRAEMQKRAKEKGITLPEPRAGMGAGMGPGAGKGMRGPGMGGGPANPPGAPASPPSAPSSKP